MNEFSKVFSKLDRLSANRDTEFQIRESIVEHPNFVPTS